VIRRRKMNPLAYWALCPTFSIVQAAFLFCGRDPSHIDRHSEAQAQYLPDGYVPVRTALVNAISRGLLPAEVRFEWYDNERSDTIDVHETQIARKDLDRFFAGAPIAGHFFGEGGNGLGPAGSNAQLPPKLNAALRAWTAVTSDPLLLRGKSPKQALRTWLTAHALELGLRKRDGELNEAGIEEICKVANWKPEGGATPTPSAMPAPVQEDDFVQYGADLDDELPF